MDTQKQNTTECLRLNLSGVLDIRDTSGATLRVSNKRARALLAMIVTTKNQRRSRNWIKAVLWSNSDEPQASSSLRQALHSLRSDLGDYGNCVRSDRDFVWLEDIALDTDATDPARAVFFEDAPSLGEEFEDWLTQERSFRETLSETADAPPVATPAGARVSTGFEQMPPRGKPCVAIGATLTMGDATVVNALADRICDQFSMCLREQENVDVFDLRDLVSNQLPSLSNPETVQPKITVQTRVTEIGSQFTIGFVARDPMTGRVVWNSMISADRTSDYMVSEDQIAEFVNQAVDSIQLAVFREDMNAPCGTPQLSMFAAVHQVLGHSFDGIKQSIPILENYYRENNSAVAQGWLALLTAIDSAECISNDAAALRDRAIRHCARALELDQNNALVLTLTGHVHNFVLRDLNYGEYLLSQARRCNSNLALAWDLSAMHALYSDDLDDGYRIAQKARRLGRFSPYKTYFDASVVMAASLTGNHKEAISLGRRVLNQRPEFLPVMRYMAASYANSGLHDDARDIIAKVRRTDKAFGTGAMFDPSYPLPSKNAARYISDSLAKVGTPDA